jgi:TonB family protein
MFSPFPAAAVVAVEDSGQRCPGTLAIESTNGRDYIAVFDSPVKTSAQFNIRLYGTKGAYDVSVASLPLATPFTSDSRQTFYRSVALDFKKTPGDDIVAANVSPRLAESAPSCADVHYFVPPVQSLVDSKRVVSKSEADLENAFGAEIGQGDNAIAMAAATDPMPACTKPFAQALLRDLALSQDVEGTGTVLLAIGLDDKGTLRSAGVASSSGDLQLDQDAVQTAKLSRYSPQIFACRAESTDRLLPIVYGAGGLVYADGASAVRRHRHHKRR